MTADQLKLLLQIPQAAALLSAKPAPGVKTTEFYLTSAVSLYAMFAPAVPMPYSIVIPALAVGLYTAARALVKAMHAFGKLPQIDDLPDLAPKA